MVFWALVHGFALRPVVSIVAGSKGQNCSLHSQKGTTTTKTEVGVRVHSAFEETPEDSAHQAFAGSTWG